MPQNIAPGYIPRQDKPLSQTKVITLTGNKNLKAVDNGALVIFDSVTSLVATLPPPRKGMSFTFYVKQIGATTGHTIAVTAGVTLKSKINPTGTTIAVVAGKGVQNNGAGAGVVGDGIFVFSDGSNWFGIPTGSWVVQP